MRKQSIYWVIIFVLAIRLATAVDFHLDTSTSSIEANYFEGDFIRGWLNISFDEQKNVDFEGSFGGKISLLDLLKNMSYVGGEDFTCNPSSCKNDYQARSGSQNKSINLKQKAVYGFKIQDNNPVEAIKDFKFKIAINDELGTQSCDNSIFLDVFDDGDLEFYNEEYITYDCPFYREDYGCFDTEDVSDQVGIGNELFCELIEDLPPAAAYRVGAKVKKERTAGPLSFVMLPANGDCDEPLSEVKESGPIPIGEHQEANATLEIKRAPTENFDAFVCVWSTAGDEGAYLINVNEEDNNLCGINHLCTQELSKDDLDVDFEIYAIPKAYKPVKEVDYTANAAMIEKLNKYLNGTYANNCSGDEGCLFPFSIWGAEFPDQRIYSAYLRYDAVGFPSTKDIFELRERSAEISTDDFLRLDIEKMSLEVPDSDGRHIFKLNLGDDEVIRKPIDVEIGFNFTIAPRFAFVGRDTAFTASTSTKVIRFIWDFGDGSAAAYSTDNSANHKYSTSGNFIVQVTLIKSGTTASSQTNSTKRFKVVVGEAKTSANLTLVDYESRINHLEADITGFPQWMRTSIREILGLDAMKSNLANKRAEFNAKAQLARTTDEEFIQIINYLLNAGVPYSIFVSESGSLPALVGFGNIDPAHIKEISGSSIDDSELSSGILSWMEKNYDVSVDFETIAAKEDDGDVIFMRKYKVKADKTAGANSESAYLIIDYPMSSSSFKFEDSAGARETNSGGTYIELNPSELSIEKDFIITGPSPSSVADLGIYISPVVSSLGLNEKPIREGCWWCDEEGQFDWNKFVIGMAILITATLAVYIILQAWYKRYYEKHLFRNPNDLYNLINFIYNSRKAGLNDKDARAKLKDKKWGGEQINYAFRKIDGKRTGMWEIPIFKFIENRKVKKEIEKKQGGKPIDRRFIKRWGV